jgi:undecaprenyl-diphosphatase
MVKKNSKLIYGFVSALIFLMILILVVIGSPGIDSVVSSWAVSVQGSSFDQFFIFLGHYSQAILIGLSLVVLFLLYIKRKKKESLILVISLASGYILEQIIKLIVQRPRPLIQLVAETSYGFPSGHSIFATILFFMVIYFYKEKIKSRFFKIFFISLNVLLILLVGFSRIYINVHWLTDIIGGFALGFAILWFSLSASNKIS